MHESKQHDDDATGVHRFPAEIRSFLETSARYFGLAEIPQQVCLDAAAASKATGVGSISSKNQYVEERGAA